MEEDISSSGYPDNLSTPGGRVDIAQFVVEVERFNCMIEPFAFLLYLWDDLRRWRYPVLTVILWTVCNLACLILTQAAVFTLVSIFVIAIATLCLVQLHTRLMDKFLPDTTNTDAWMDEPTDEHMALQTVRDFKFSLMQMHDFVIKCNEYLRYFYSLLKWDSTRPALRFHVEVCFLLLCAVIFPTRWTVTLLTNWFFLATEDVFYGARRRIGLLIEFGQGKRTLGSVFEKASPVSSSNGTIQMDSASGGTDTLEASDSEDIAAMTDSDKLNDTGQMEEEETGDSASQNDSKPGMVARLMELKRRRKLIANECCFECKTSFSSILKRRYCCCHCGNNFCSKCCNQKVPKSLLGATAPSAQTATVLVCVKCHKQLLGDKEKSG